MKVNSLRMILSLLMSWGEFKGVPDKDFCGSCIQSELHVV
jgi:hypothetical protein